MHQLKTYYLLFLLAFIVGIINAQEPLIMLDSSLDKPGEEWSYLAKSTTVIGVPFQPDVTQVTYDGALFTRNAELCFFYGKKDQPLLARAKTFLKGWIPVLQYNWKEDGIEYHIEYFSSPLEGEDVSNTVNFVRLSMTNPGSAPATGSVAIALRHSGKDYRNGRIPFDPHWAYDMTNNGVFRNEKLCYSFSGTPQREAVPGVAYREKFYGDKYEIGSRAECGITRYKKVLNPHQSFSVELKMPRVPVDRKETALINKITKAAYSDYKTRIIAYWEKLLAKAPVFDIPEKRFQHAYRASLVHVLLSTRTTQKNIKIQTDGLPYPDFFLTSVPEIATLYLTAGLDSMCTGLLIPGAVSQQQDNGLYYDKAVAQGVIIPATQGHILYSAAQTILFTQNKPFARKIYPSLQKAVGFIKNSIDTGKYGLLPRCWPYDAEMIDGYYTGQNMFALMGLRYAVRVARLQGEEKDVNEWTALAGRYENNITRAIDASAKSDGYVPTGLYDYITGQKARKEFDEYLTDADWENMILAWPTEVLQPTDARVIGTLRHVRKDYAEGIMTYRHGMYLHQYITSNMIEQYLAMGDSYAALRDFYHQLLHSGSTHESFENLVKPWTNRMVDPGCPTPHAWGTAKQGLMVRNFLLMEYGGKCGMEKDKRELWMFHSLSPAWTKPGDKISLSNAPTEFGTAGATMNITKNGASVSFNNRFHEKPAYIRIRLPYFKDLVNFSSNARESKREGDCILLSPDVTTLTLQWKDKKGSHLHTVENILVDYRSANRFTGADKEGKAIIERGKPFVLDSEKSNSDQILSFETVKKAFAIEYARLAAQQVNAGKKLIVVTAPAMLDAVTRGQLFAKEFPGKKTVAAAQ